MKTGRFSSHGAFVVVLGLLAFAGEAFGQELHPRQLYQQTLEGTVAIGRKKFIATGCVVDAGKKWILTSRHNVDQPGDIFVLFPEFDAGKLITDEKHYLKKAKLHLAKIVYQDSKCDLALLEVENIAATAKALKLAPTSPGAGELLHIVGNPSNVKDFWVFRTGKVQQVFQGNFDYKEIPIVTAKVVESNLATFFGDSGAPVVNSRAELTGIHMGKNLWSQSGATVLHIDVSEIQQFLNKAAASR